MAKLQDKFFNRVIEGDLELESNEKAQVIEAVEEDSSLKVFEDIVDKDGHKRFVEGDIDTATISGVSFTYGKWSLSGTHLMIVIAFDIVSGTFLNSLSLGTITLPKWIYDKIVPLWADAFIEVKTLPVYNDDWTNQNLSVALSLKGNNQLDIRIPAVSFTASRNRSARFGYDLLIDNE